MALALVLGYSAHVMVRYPVPQYEPDLRTTATLIAKMGRPGDLLAFSGQYPWWADVGVRYYLRQDRRVAFQVTTGSPVPSYAGWCHDEAGCLRGHARIWLVNTQKGNSKLPSFAGMAPSLAAVLHRTFAVSRVDRPQGVTLSLLVPYSDT